MYSVFIYSSLRKNSNALHSLLKRVVSTFSKDTGELASSFLEFMRQILNSDTMVSVHKCFLNLQTFVKLKKPVAFKNILECFLEV